jgi:hypothetical protein
MSISHVWYAQKAIQFIAFLVRHRRASRCGALRGRRLDPREGVPLLRMLNGFGNFNSMNSSSSGEDFFCVEVSVIQAIPGSGEMQLSGGPVNSTSSSHRPEHCIKSHVRVGGGGKVIAIASTQELPGLTFGRAQLLGSPMRAVQSLLYAIFVSAIDKK